MSLSEESHARWLKKRKLTTIAFTLQNVLLGCEYGIVFSNLWLYIDKLLKTDNAKVYYSLIFVSYLLSSIASGIFMSKLADKNRNIGKILFYSNAALVVGNIIYMIPFSPWILLVGRVIAGTGLPQRSVITGELARCYPHEELTSILSIMSIATSFGFMAAPGINIAFYSVDFWIGKFHVTYANISGFYMAIAFVIGQIIGTLMIYDLSKEYDLKDSLADKSNYPLIISNTVATEESHLLPEGSETGTLCRPIIDVNNCASTSSDVIITEEISLRMVQHENTVAWLFKELITHVDTLLLLALCFFETFLITSFDMCLPIIVINLLKWPVSTFNAILLATGFISILPCIVLMVKTIPDPVIFYISVVSIFGYGLLQLIQLLWVVYNNISMAINIVSSVLYCLLFANVMIIKDVFICGFLAKMVSSRNQALADSIRNAMESIGSIAAFFLAPYALEIIDIIGFVYIVIISTFVFLLILRRKTLKNPNVIISK